MTRPSRAELAAECEELRAALLDVQSVLDELLDEDGAESDDDAAAAGDALAEFDLDSDGVDEEDE
ncbi:MAG TPA: hypothetical protein VGJ96_04105 [Gemmatimonadaceae bacterium]|jgi:hypothetical protein